MKHIVQYQNLNLSPSFIYPIIAILIGLALAIPSPSQAVEGMWLPEQLPELTKQHEALGWQHANDDTKNKVTSATQKTKATKSIFDGIVSLGGCSGAFVSQSGLVITNHHCAYSSIQYNTTEEKQYLRDGFVAQNLADELPAAPGSRIFIRMSEEDVSATMLSGVTSSMSGYNVQQLLEWRQKKLIADCESDPSVRCRIASFYSGSQYTLIKNLVIKDVRLVYAPPTTIGAFGGDTDNWMWPRHAGDFAFYRAYWSKEGTSKEYHPDNVPFESPSHLKWAPQGLKSGDFAMVVGYPGRTNRHRLAVEARQTFAIDYERQKRSLAAEINVLESAMKDRPPMAITYAADLAWRSNRFKSLEGMIAGYKKNQEAILESKTRKEADFRQWLEQKNDRETLEALKGLEELVERKRIFDEDEWILGESTSSKMWDLAERIYRHSIESAKRDEDRKLGFQKRDLESFKSSIAQLEKRFDEDVDISLWINGIRRAQSYLKERNQSLMVLYPSLAQLWRQNDDQLRSTLSTIYKSSKLRDPTLRTQLIEKNTHTLTQELRALKDPLIEMIAASMPMILDRERESQELEGQFQRQRSKLMTAWRAFHKEHSLALYPDANGTLRFTYGSIKSFASDKDVMHPEFTFLPEIATKNGPDEFAVPAPLLQAIQQSSKQPIITPIGTFEGGQLPINFITDLDITGGNSGSATINQQGALVGLAFDGNIEGVISDWHFTDAKTRAIHVDSRYILWLMSRVYPAPHLLKEMSLGQGAEAI